jgi:outer membrane protein OmpA-like peptidoglycan-associated protein
MQIAALEGKTKQEQAEKQRLEAEKRATEARLAEEKQAAEQRLAEERQFNELYNEVQTFFEPEEAEVYKKVDKLIIRLRSIQFPIGKAIIMPENYAVLSKVQKAILTFGEPEVTIEGHTDSTGPTTVNELLSQQRAEAVRAYLAANKTVPGEKITAVGYGSVRPLASNADEEGRAINRRIDVIISPMAQTVK